MGCSLTGWVEEKDNDKDKWIAVNEVPTVAKHHELFEELSENAEKLSYPWEDLSDTVELQYGYIGGGEVKAIELGKALAIFKKHDSTYEGRDGCLEYKYFNLYWYPAEARLVFWIE